MDTNSEAIIDLLSYSKKFSRQERRNIYEGRCIYCREKFNFLTLDHFIPRAKGGRHCMENLVPACLSCNGDKGLLFPDDWFFDQSFFSYDQWQDILSYVGDIEIQRLTKKNSKRLREEIKENIEGTLCLQSKSKGGFLVKGDKVDLTLPFSNVCQH